MIFLTSSCNSLGSGCGSDFDKAALEYSEVDNNELVVRKQLLEAAHNNKQVVADSSNCLVGGNDCCYCSRRSL